MGEKGSVSVPERRKGSWGEGLSPIFTIITLIMLYQWWESNVVHRNFSWGSNILLPGNHGFQCGYGSQWLCHLGVVSYRTCYFHTLVGVYIFHQLVLLLEYRENYICGKERSIGISIKVFLRSFPGRRYKTLHRRVSRIYHFQQLRRTCTVFIWESSLLF